MAVSQMRKSSNGKSYYLGADGAMVTSQTVNWEGKEYQVDSEGVCSEKNDVDAKIEKFMSSAELIGNWYVNNVSTYLKGGNGNEGKRKDYYCNILNKNVGDDCSSYVSSCLNHLGYINSNTYSSYDFNPGKGENSNIIKERLTANGFVWHSYTDDYIPKRGDISVQHKGKNAKGDANHHVEIVDSYNPNNGMISIWSWGDVYKSLPITRSLGERKKRISGYWRIEN